MNFLIVTGLSGAGKSMAVNALEDIGFFCIDNIPVALLPRIVDFALQGENQLNRVAVVMDVRGVRSIEKLQEALDIVLPKFGLFNVRLRMGVFWNYFEENGKKAPKVHEENTFPCRFIRPNKKSQLSFQGDIL